MTETTKSASRYIGYECQEKMVNGDLMQLYADNYPYFGWQLASTSKPLAGVNRYLLKFTRDRKIINKVELTRLQRQFDSYVKDIETMEKSKVITAAMAAYTVGVLGAAFMAGSVFAFLAGMLPLCIMLAGPAFLGWVVSYPCYRAIEKRKTAEVQPFIEQKYEELYSAAERAHALTN